MNNEQEEIELKEMSQQLDSHGEDFVLSEGEKVTITHKLGGNFTVAALTVCIVLPLKMLILLEKKAIVQTQKHQTKMLSLPMKNKLEKI